MRVSNVPALRKYAQVLDRLRQGQNPGSLLFTFGFDKQLYVPGPLKIRMPSFDENYFGQGYIAMVFNNTTLAGGQKDGEFQFADIELRLGSGFLALSKEAAQTVLAKEMAMIESRFGLLKATTRGKK